MYIYIYISWKTTLCKFKPNIKYQNILGDCIMENNKMQTVNIKIFWKTTL